MKVWILTLVAANALFAVDPQQLALSVKAESEFDRVELAPLPSLSDTGLCVQSQAAMLPVSAPTDGALLYFRRGYCTLAGAALTADSREYEASAADFDRALAAWPARRRKTAKPQPPEPVSSALRILPWIARLHASTDAKVQAAARTEIESALAAPACNSNLLPETVCERVLETGREWLGWMALEDRRLEQAAGYFAGSRDSGWPEWVEGRRRFALGNYAEAAAQQERAVATWKVLWRESGTSLSLRLGPKPDVAVALADLGGSQLLAGDARRAIASLDASLKANPDNPEALYRRARAHDLAGDREAALADYGMAARTAFAGARDLASGEAHLYRGVLLYRRKDFARAEGEFASALNFEIPEALRPDARAWRSLAAVAGGACGAARQTLNERLDAVSPYFPKQEARQAAAACRESSNIPAP